VFVNYVHVFNVKLTLVADLNVVIDRSQDRQ
jgi:hypothetical protein